MRNFKELRIWQKGVNIAVDCFKLVKDFPNDERFGICRQITKSGVSIPSNIAEGSSRKSEKDYARFIEISLGSSFELETQLIISQLAELGNQDLIKSIMVEVIDEQKMISGFYDTLGKG